MPSDLTPVEVRVVGSLMEKEVTTPDAYPLTRNALVAACNQSTGRAPCLQLEHHEIEMALHSLKARGLVRFVHPSHGGRSEKYRHVVPEALELGPAERALLCLLALRGPQTPSELKNRADRLHTFASLDEVQHALEALAERPEPLATRLPRRLGQKELRWAHLLCGVAQAGDLRDGDLRDGDLRDGDLRDGDLRDGELRDGEVRDGELRDGADADRPLAPAPRADRLADLEDRVAELEATVAALRGEL